MKTEDISASEKEYYTNQTRLLLAKMVKVRQKATDLGQKSYVSTLNSFIRTLAQLLRGIGQSKVDKNKVEQILGVMTKKVDEMDADLDQTMITKTAEEATTVGETLRPTIKSKEGQISSKDRTQYIKQARSLIKECVRLRKKASQSGQQKYVGALNSYIKALARLMKEVRKPTFNKKQVENALILLKSKISEAESVLEPSFTTEKKSMSDETVEGTMSVSEVGDLIFLTNIQCIFLK